MDALTHTQHVLAVGWWVAVAVCVCAYIILDGADLGAGIVSLFIAGPEDRGAVMQAMAGTWDANETWLIIAGGILFGSFPFAYGSVLAYLMVPLMFVLWGILTRAVALEFRHLAATWSQAFTDLAFGLSSLGVTFFGGVCVGAVLEGFPLTHDPGQAADRVPEYVGGALRCFTAFSLWTGVAAVVAVTLSGCLFIRARFNRDEPIRLKAASWTDAAFCCAIVAVIVTVAWSALAFPWARNNWLGQYFWVWGLVLLVALGFTVMMQRAAKAERDFHALLWLDATIVVMAAGMIATLYPAIVPGTWTIFEAASPNISLFTFLLATVFLLPVVVMYNWYQIWVFRARISRLASYHE